MSKWANKLLAFRNRTRVKHLSVYYVFNSALFSQATYAQTSHCSRRRRRLTYCRNRFNCYILDGLNVLAREILRSVDSTRRLNNIKWTLRRHYRLLLLLSAATGSDGDDRAFIMRT